MDELLEYIIARIVDNANDVLEIQGVNDFEKGRREAYYEVLDTIKNELMIHEKDHVKFGLINLEKKFLNMEYHEDGEG